MTDMAALSVQSARLRQARAEIRRGLRDRSLSLADVLTDPPPPLHGLSVLDVIRLAQHSPRTSNEQYLGRLALRDQVNLLVRVETASSRTREWAARHAVRHLRTGGSWR